MPTPISDRVRKRRDALRAAGLRPVQSRHAEAGLRGRLPAALAVNRALAPLPGIAR